MKKANKSIALCALIALFLCLGMIFANTQTASAEDTEPSAIQEQTEQPKDDSFTALFNEKILPIIIGAGSTVMGFLFIDLRSIAGKREFKKLKEAYAQVHGRNEVYEDEINKLRAAAGQVDYTKIIAESIEKGVGEHLRMYDKIFAEMGINQKAQNEQFAAFMKAAQAVWGDKIPAAAEALNALPTVRLLKKYELENALLKDKIAEYKGDEADKAIAKISAAVEERV